MRKLKLAYVTFEGVNFALELVRVLSEVLDCASVVVALKNKATVDKFKVLLFLFQTLNKSQVSLHLS